MSARSLQSLADHVGHVLSLLSRVAPSERGLSVIADDSLTDDGSLFSPSAFAVIRAGTQERFPVGNVMAFNGNVIREFAPVWRAIIDELGLAGAERVSPFAEITSRDIADSISRLVNARNRLLAKINSIIARPSPPIAERSSIWPWILAAAAVGVAAKKLKSKS